MTNIPEVYKKKQGRPSSEYAQSTESRDTYIKRKSIQASMIADGALDYGLSFYAEVTTYTDTTHFKAAGLAGKGTGAFKTTAGAPYEIYVMQADGAAPEGQMTPVVAYTSADGTFQHAAYSGGNLAVGDIVLVIHPLLASLGTKATDAATGAVTTTDFMMAYIKQLVTLQIAADIVAGNIVDDITAAVDEPPTAKSLQDILHKDTNYTYSKATDALEAIRDRIDTLNTADQGDLDQLLIYCDILDHATNGLANIKSLIDTLDGVADGIKAVTDNLPDSGALNDLATIKGYTDLIDDATNGLAAIKAEVEGLAGAAMRGTDNAALASVLGALNDAAASGAVTDVDTAMAYIKQLVTAMILVLADTGELQTDWANGGRLDNLLDTAAAGGGGYTHSDWKGNFNWDTSAYTTVEQDISALFSTNLAIATRRKYSVKLDLTAVEADGSFTELYLAVKEKIDGTNYRAIDRKTVTKANIAAAAEPGIVIDIPATSENVQITMIMAAALAGDATIYYAVVLEALE